MAMLAGRWRLAVVAGLVVVRQAGELIDFKIRPDVFFAPFFRLFFPPHLLLLSYAV